MDIIFIILSIGVFVFIVVKLNQMKTKLRPNYQSYMVGFWGISLISLIIGIIAGLGTALGLYQTGLTENAPTITFLVSEEFTLTTGAILSMIAIFMRQNGFKTALASAIGIAYTIELIFIFDDLDNSWLYGLAAGLLIIILAIVSLAIRNLALLIIAKNKKPRN